MTVSRHVKEVNYSVTSCYTDTTFMHNSRSRQKCEPNGHYCSLHQWCHTHQTPIYPLCLSPLQVRSNQEPDKKLKRLPRSRFDLADTGIIISSWKPMGFLSVGATDRTAHHKPVLQRLSSKATRRATMECHCASAMNGKASVVIKSSKCIESNH